MEGRAAWRGVIVLFLLISTSEIPHCRGQTPTREDVFLRPGGGYTRECPINNQHRGWFNNDDASEITFNQNLDPHQIYNSARTSSRLVIVNFDSSQAITSFLCSASRLELDVQVGRAPTDIILNPSPSAIFNETLFNETTPTTTDLTCSWTAVGPRPQPTATWSISLHNGTNFEVVTLTYSMPLHRNYTGNYTCTVANDIGSQQNFTTILVQHPPEVSVESPGSSSLGEVAEGSTLQLRCTIFAIPNATAASFFFTNYTTNETTHLISYSVEMMLNETSVTVEHNISNVRVSEHSGAYICGATNIIGGYNSSKSIIVVGPPSAPLRLNVSVSSSTSVLLTWEDPTDNGNSSITDFYANCTTLTGTPHTVIQGLSLLNNTDLNTTAYNNSTNMTIIRMLNVTELHSGETYQCTVFASNFGGNGTASNAVNVSLGDAEPCTPELSMYNTSSSTASEEICLSWRVDCDGGRNITNCSLYRSDGVRFSWQGTHSLCATDGTDKLFCDKTDKVPGRLYMYTFFTANSIGGVQSSINLTADMFTEPPTTDDSSSGLSTGAIVGIVIAIIIALIIVIIIIVLLVRSASGDDKSPIYDKTRTDSPVTGIRFQKSSSPPGAGGDGQTKYAKIDFEPSKRGSSNVPPMVQGTGKEERVEYAHVDIEKTERKYDSPPQTQPGLPAPVDDVDGSTIV